MTPRQYEALYLMAQGHTYLQCAELMGISYQTFKNTLAGAYTAIGACGAIHAMNLMGWVTLPLPPSTASREVAFRARLSAGG